MTPLGIRATSPVPAKEKYAVVKMYPDSWDPYISVTNVTVRTGGKNGGKKRCLSVKNVVKYLKVPAGTSLEIKDALS